MLPDRVSNPGPLTYESGALPIALRGLPMLVAYGYPTKLYLTNSLALPSSCMRICSTLAISFHEQILIMNRGGREGGIAGRI